MKDVNNPLLKAYYSVLSALYPTYEGEEPDDVADKMYIVLSDVSSSDFSTKTSTGTTSQIQVTINSWALKYNNSKALNNAAGAVLTALKPTPNAVLDMSADNIQMTNLSISTDRVLNYGKLAGRVYISRQIIFNQNLFIKN